jgi:naphthalene 1,2-dioxygenase ferredoxin reductase component
MQPQLLVQPFGRSIKFVLGTSLLEVLRTNQIPISHSCMSGRCGTCRYKVLGGQVLSLKPSQASAKITAGEYALACMSAPQGDCEIEVLEPDEIVFHPAKIVRGTVEANDKLTSDIRRIVIRMSKPLSYSPGQYVNVQFEHGLSRPYSMATAGESLDVEFHIRLISDGRAGTYIDSKLKIGDSVRLSGPMGTAYLRRAHKGPVICIAGGTGLAPILSILRGAIAAAMSNPIHIYYGVRSPEDAYGLEWIEAILRVYRNATFHLIVENAGLVPQHRPGLLTEALISDFEDLTDFSAYVCGSPGMVSAVEQVLLTKSLPPTRVYADAFYSSPE